MIYIETGSTDVYYNFGLENYFATEKRLPDTVFLFWRTTPTLMVGKYQNILEEINKPYADAHGIHLVRRMSGGGTVYHDLGNLNYTLISDQTGPLDYDRCLEPVIRALNALGIPAQKNRTCDIAVDGKKISGSAQKIAGGRVLHHGTLLFDSDLSLLDEITTGRKNDAFCSKGTESAICTVTNLRPYLKDDCEIVTFAKRLAEQLLPPGSEQIRLTEPQLAEVRRLADETYHAWDWTWGKTPAFTYEKTAEFAGKPIFVRYEAKHGLLRSAEVRSDVLDAQAASAMLNGARLDPALFLDICRTLAGEQAEELLDCLM